MDSETPTPQECSNLNSSSRLRIFTKLLREPVVVSGSAYRSGAHPILATRVAAEVARSPKVGLVEKLMEESRLAFLERDYPCAIVKSLAAEELLRKYGGILAPEKETDIRDQLQFLKIQYFLLSGQAGEAFRVLKEIRHLSHPYLWHQRMARRSGVTASHWRAMEASLRLFFTTGRSGKIFALLGYVTVMGSEPSRAAGLEKELDFTLSAGERLYDALYHDYCFLTTRVTQKARDYLPEYLASEYRVTPLLKEGQTTFVGTAADLCDRDLQEIEVRLGGEAVAIPMGSRPLRDRNSRLYAS